MAGGNPTKIPEMVERVARSVYEARHGRMGIVNNFYDWPSEYRASYYADAIAAIMALHEPTEAMVRVISAGCGATPECEFDEGLARERIRLMIDAALKE